MSDITEYLSTVNSVVYLVSEGYSNKETIRGVKTGTTVTGFLEGIIKANEKQSLTLKASSDGSDLTGDAILNMNDTLVVLAADSVNTTKYVLDVSDEGLSSDARLTSSRYKITFLSEPKSAGGTASNGTATITGFEYGTTLRTILTNVTEPAGATVMAIDEKGAYVPLKMLNFDTAYVDITVNDKIYLEVIAENGITAIVYQLLPSSSEKDAFVLSNVYNVSQKNQVIQFIPRGTIPENFLANLIPATGATLKLVDKLGSERTDGQVFQDDKLIVTAADGVTVKVYYLGMLATQTHPENNYLAYVVSNIYTVDQLGKVITGPTGSTPLSEFFSRITAVLGAVPEVVDINGDVKTSGDLNDGDMLKVTSADGKTEVMYELALDLTAVDLLSDREIVLYPNPTTNKVNINGLETGSRVQVFNSMGAVISEKITSKNIEIISLDIQSSGIYIITITNKNKFIGSYKVIKK